MKKITCLTLLIITCFNLLTAQTALDFEQGVSPQEVVIPTITCPSEFTFEAWVNNRGSSGFTTILEFGNDAPYFGLSSNRLTLYNNVVNSTEEIPLNEWVHVAVSYSAINTEAKLYVNGVLEDTNSNASLNITGVGAGIGYNTGDNSFNGAIDDVRIWNVVRTEAEISGSINTCFTGTETGLYAFYNFNERTGTVLNDLTSNNFNGTLMNMDPATDWVVHDFCNSEENVLIPDTAFKSVLLQNASINTDSNNEISYNEAINYTGSLFLRHKSISDLTGIEAFTNITSIDCIGNNLSTVNLFRNTKLTSLLISSNNLVTLNLSANTNLITLDCSHNKLTNLNISGLNQLTDLNCGNNALEAIDVSTNTALINFSCLDNVLINLDISNSTSLVNFDCRNNALTVLNAANGNNENMTTFRTENNNLDCIQVDDKNYSDVNWSNFKDSTTSYSENCSGCIVDIPDANFKTSLLNDHSIDTNNDGAISCDEANDYTRTINVDNKDISSLTGIEAFVNISNLSCNTNNLITLDLSNNIKLQTIYCDFNELTQLNVSSLDKLTRLNCIFNKLETIDLSTNIVLDRIECYNNALTSLDFTANTVLQQVYCFRNRLINLDISNNASMIQLQCHFNNLTSLNVANGNNTNLFVFATSNPDLECVQVDNKNYSDINWSSGIDSTAFYSENCEVGCIATITDNNFKNSLLNDHIIDTNNDGIISCDEAAAYTGGINVDNKAIESLSGISSFTKITSLSCNDNNLSALDVSLNTALTYLSFNNNSIGNIDLFANGLLKELYCNNNLLPSIHLLRQSALKTLSCDNNNLTSISSLFATTALTTLSCSSNKIEDLDVSNNIILTQLNCASNNLTSLNLANGNNINFSLSSDFKNNPSLTCIEVDDFSFSNTNWDALKDVGTNYSKDCSTLSINESFAKTISIYPNPTKTNITINLIDTIEQVEVMTLLGEKVYTSTTKTINVSHLSSGVYLLKIITQEGKVAVKKIVKK